MHSPSFHYQDEDKIDDPEDLKKPYTRKSLKPPAKKTDKGKTASAFVAPSKKKQAKQGKASAVMIDSDSQ